MRGPSISLLVLGVLIGVICWGVYYLLKKMLPFFQHRANRYAYILVTIAALAIMFFSRNLSQAGLPPVLGKAAVWWMMGLLILLPLMLLWRGLLAVERRTGKIDLSRRSFLKSSTVVLPALSLGLSAKGIYESGDIITQRYEFSFPNFPRELGKLKIVQISDSHIGPFFGPDALDRALNLTAREQPDLVVITGDLIDDLNLLDVTLQKLTDFQSSLPYGMYFTWGNHEYFRDQNRIRQALTDSPIRVLENSSWQLRADLPFYLLGVDYPWAKNAEEMRTVREKYLKLGLEKVPEDAFKVLLSHHPDFIDDAFKAGIPLTLTGHTHGGQVNVAGHSLLPVQYKYMRGLYHQGDFIGYVSTGTGNWLPFRLGCPAEISVFTLSV